jgi:hypothetical protein
MDHEQAKRKNSSRRFRDENIIKKQLKIAKLKGFESSNQVLEQPHRLIKHHAMDCGNPHCGLCGNPRHIRKDKLTAQEKRLFQDLDSVRDIHGNGMVPDKDIE